MTNDWIEHNGGPQPVGDDVWVEIDEGHIDHDCGAAREFDWNREEWFRWNVINQHLIDAALKRGIELGLEAAAKEVGAGRWRWSTWENHPRMSQWAKSVQSAYEHCEFLIRNLNPETIAKEAKTT